MAGEKRRKKYKGNPSKRHRDRLNAELDNLAKLLPFPEETISKLDKISILRLTVSYLKAKSYFQVCATKNKSPIHGRKDQNDLSMQFEGNGMMSQLLLEALDGFIMIITTEGKLFYVSESVRDFLGYSQATLMHQSLYKFLHIDDHKTVESNLVWGENCDSTSVTEEDETSPSTVDDVFISAKHEKSFACRIKCTMSHGGGFYKMFQCRGRMRKIHIKKREIDSIEYGLFAVISPMNTIPSSSTLELVRKQALLAPQRPSFHLDQNLNLTETYPLTSPYKTFLDPRHIQIPPTTPNSEPPTPTSYEAGLRRTFFPPSFTYGPGTYLHPGIKRRSSSSSGANEDSSMTDENTSSEGSVDSLVPRRRVSFRLDEDKPAEKREKIGNHRRLSAPAFPSQPVASSGYDVSPYTNLLHPGTPNWLYPSPFSSSFLGYQESLHGRPYLSPGFLPPMYSPFSPGGMYSPYSPYLKRASSYPNITPSGDQTYPGVPMDNAVLLSPRVAPYDPFSYFFSNTLGSRKSSESSLVGESLSKKKNGKEEVTKEQVDKSMKEKDEKIKNDGCYKKVEDMEVVIESNPKLEVPTISIEHCEDLPCEELESTQDASSAQRSPTYECDTSCKKEPDDHVIQETLADIAQNFTSKLDSIRSSFTLSLDRNVASCLGKKQA